MLKSISSNKATLCNGNTCVTVYGQTAKFLQVVVVVVAVTAAAAFLANLLKK